MHVLYFVLPVLSIFLKGDRVSERTPSPWGKFGHFSLEFVREIKVRQVNKIFQTISLVAIGIWY